MSTRAHKAKDQEKSETKRKRAFPKSNEFQNKETNTETFHNDHMAVSPKGHKHNSKHLYAHEGVQCDIVKSI